MADWSSLTSDLVRCVGDCLLATDDIDYFMNLRAACRRWRSATDDPKASPADPRFHARQWVMLDEHKTARGSGADDTSRLFLNTTTGRYLRRELPRLGDYYFITSTGGLLVLSDRSPPHAARVVNPFTASSLRFMAPAPASPVLHATAYLQAGPSPTLVLLCGQFGTAYSAEPDAERFGAVELHSMLDKLRSIWGIADQQMTALLSSIVFSSPEMYPYPRYYLVESAGEMLLIRHQRAGRSVEVFRVDAERKSIEPTRCIGSRALFLGDRCLSVDSDKFPSIDGNCIFYMDRDQHGAAAIYMYDLKARKEERISKVIDGFGIIDKFPPFTLIQLLVHYCTSTPPSQLAHEQIDRQWQETKTWLENTINALPPKF